MLTSPPIRIWNRQKQQEEIERVYGQRWMELAYGTKPGQLITDRVLSRKALSKLYGLYQGSSLSRSKIAPFIREFGIAMEEFEPGPFRSFNEFFIRRFKPGARQFVTNAASLPAFCEARYLAWDRVLSGQTFPVKGASLSPSVLLGEDERPSGRGWAHRFAGGPLVIARLCPTDYHRFHFPDSGNTVSYYTVPGKLHSVNPTALRLNSDIFWTNERQVSILETEQFGTLAYIEVGALCVGRIVQSHPARKPFRRGDEKGYFLFGASTVILLGEPGRWTPDQDILERTSRQMETFVRLGEKIGSTF